MRHGSASSTRSNGALVGHMISLSCCSVWEVFYFQMPAQRQHPHAFPDPALGEDRDIRLEFLRVLIDASIKIEVSAIDALHQGRPFVCMYERCCFPSSAAWDHPHENVFNPFPSSFTPAADVGKERTTNTALVNDINGMRQFLRAEAAVDFFRWHGKEMLAFHIAA